MNLTAIGVITAIIETRTTAISATNSGNSRNSVYQTSSKSSFAR